MEELRALGSAALPGEVMESPQKISGNGSHQDAAAQDDKCNKKNKNVAAHKPFKWTGFPQISPLKNSKGGFGDGEGFDLSVLSSWALLCPGTLEMGRDLRRLWERSWRPTDVGLQWFVWE